MRREDKRLYAKMAEPFTTLVGDRELTPASKRRLVKSLRPIFAQLQNEANRAIYEAMRNTRVRFVYRPKLPK